MPGTARNWPPFGTASAAGDFTIDVRASGLCPEGFTAETAKGIGYITVAVALATAGLTLAGVIEPDTLKDPFGL